MNTKPAIGFLTKDGQGSFTDKVTAILQWMTDNPSYPTPVPALGSVQTAFDTYKVATADAAQALEGKISGVTIVQNSGAPGGTGGTGIKIRGISSLTCWELVAVSGSCLKRNRDR